jgi:hypothetical protein
MGFNMKSKILASFALLAFLGLSACKETNGDPVDYGPVVSADEIDAALSAPIAKMDPMGIQKGEYSHLEVHQIVAAQIDTLTSESALTITDRSEDASKVILTYIDRQVTYGTNGKPSQVALEDQIILNKTPSPSPTPALEAAASLSNWTPDKLISRALTGRVSAQDTQPSNVSFHNLELTSEVSFPPALAASQPQCLGIPGCQIHLFHIDYDMVVQNSDTDIQKIHRLIVVSPDVPFLSRKVRDCITLLVGGTTGGKTLVTQCSNLVDFRFHDAIP